MLPRLAPDSWAQVFLLPQPVPGLLTIFMSFLKCLQVFFFNPFNWVAYFGLVLYSF
jgi:hypothetical protein